MTIVLRGGLVIDRSGERVADVEIGDDGRIAAVGTGLSGDVDLDASGCVVSPGFVDLHTHLREPGQEDAETIETGARGGALGGYTALVAMPNTEPTMDCAAVVELVRTLGRGTACEIVPTGALTVGHPWRFGFGDEPCDRERIMRHQRHVDSVRAIEVVPAGLVLVDEQTTDPGAGQEVPAIARD